VKRRAFLGAASGAMLACDRRPRLNVYNWSSYIAPETVPNFERESGARVRYSVYESNEEMLAKVITGNSGWDVVFPTHSRIGPMRANGLLKPLDHKRLPNLKYLSPDFQAPAWDTGLQWSVPYMWNATGIAYRKKLGIARWSDLWRGDLIGRITMLDDSEDVIGACLQKLGMPFNATDQKQLEAAKQEAVRQKRLVRAYINAEVKDQLVAGDVIAAQLWSTTASQAMSASAEISFAYPEEGYPLYADNAVILGRSDLAHEFINYLLRPAVAAANAKAAETATCNATGDRTNKVLYPPKDVLARGTWPVALPRETQRFRDRIWTEIKSA
jgi:spermidine/putrescine transport system substrate-binding protein